MPTDSKTIDSYNNNTKMWLHGKKHAHEFLEKPAMFTLLPNLKDKKVLCVGCGAGDECADITKRGASQVVGIDLSTTLIDIAKKRHPHHEFHVMDMEEMNFPKKSFDVIFCSLAIHYLQDWRNTLERMHHILNSDGYVIMSVPHPACWGSSKRASSEWDESFLLGYSTKGEYGDCEVYGDYLTPHRIADVWYGGFEVVFYHRPLSDIFHDFKLAGFSIDIVDEPKPVPSSREKAPVWFEIWSKIPQFMLFRLKKSPV